MSDGEARRASACASACAAIADGDADRGWDVRGRGMMQALDVVDGAFAKEVQRVSFENGLLIGPCGTGGRVLKLIPPLTIPDDDLEEGLDILCRRHHARWRNRHEDTATT